MRVVRTAGATLAAVAIVLTAACGGDDTEPDSDLTSFTPTTAAATTETSAAPTPEFAPAATAEEGWTGFWRALSSAQETADPDAPGLAVYADGVALIRAQDYLGRVAAAGVVGVGEVVVTGTSVTQQLGPESFVVNSCVDHTGVEVRDTSGTPVAGVPAPTATDAAGYVPDTVVTGLRWTGGGKVDKVGDGYKVVDAGFWLGQPC